MGVKIFYVSNGCKKLLHVKWEKNYFTYQMSVKIFEVSNGNKKV